MRAGEICGEVGGALLAPLLGGLVAWRGRDSTGLERRKPERWDV